MDMQKRSNFKKFLSVLMVLCMMLSVMPAFAAAEVEPIIEETVTVETTEQTVEQTGEQTVEQTVEQTGTETVTVNQPETVTEEVHYAARIGETNYVSVAAAVAAAGDGAAIKLLSNSTEQTIKIAKNQSISIDLNGHVLNASICNLGLLSIIDSATYTGQLEGELITQAFHKVDEAGNTIDFASGTTEICGGRICSKIIVEQDKANMLISDDKLPETYIRDGLFFQVEYIARCISPDGKEVVTGPTFGKFEITRGYFYGEPPAEYIIEGFHAVADNSGMYSILPVEPEEEVPVQPQGGDEPTGTEGGDGNVDNPGDEGNGNNEGGNDSKPEETEPVTVETVAEAIPVTAVNVKDNDLTELSYEDKTVVREVVNENNAVNAFIGEDITEAISPESTADVLTSNSISVEENTEVALSLEINATRAKVEDGVVTAMAFDIKPIAVVDGTGETARIPNDHINPEVGITVRLPIDGALEADEVRLIHEGELYLILPIQQDESGNRYIQFLATSFSIYEYEAIAKAENKTEYDFILKVSHTGEGDIFLQGNDESLTPTGGFDYNDTVSAGTTVSFIFAPKIGNVIESVTVNGSAISPVSNVFTAAITEDTEVLVNFEKADDKCAVQFVYDDGNTPDPEYLDPQAAGETITLPTVPTTERAEKQYYEFAGWLCDADGKTYAGGAEYTISDPIPTKKAVIFTAQWTPKSYKISYVLNGGSTQPNPDVLYLYQTGENSLKLKDPSSRSGYRFGGWYLDSGFKNKVSTLDAKDYSGDITLYAKWNRLYFVKVYWNNYGKVYCNGTQLNKPSSGIATVQLDESQGAYIVTVPNSGYYTYQITLNGKKMGSISQLAVDYSDAVDKSGTMTVEVVITFTKGQGSPNTGDDANVLLFASLMALSGTAAYITFNKRRKAKNK